MTICALPLLLSVGLLGTDVRDRFTAEYPAALAALEAKFSQVRFTATIDTYDHAVQKTDFACRGRAFRVMTRVEKADREDQVGCEHVYVATPTGETFYLRKFSRTDEYVLIAENIDHDALTEFRRQLLPAFAPYCIETQRIADLMAEDDFRVTDVREVDVEGERGVRVDWQSAYLNPQVGRIRKSGWMTLLPARCWVLKEYQLAYAQKDEPFQSCLRVVVSYGKPTPSDPIVTGVEEWKELDKERRRQPVASFIDVVMERGSFPDEEFSLRRFGVRVPPPPFAQPVSLLPDHTDVGAVSPSQAKIVTFTVKNSASHDVRVLGATTSCGCRMESDLPFTLPPGKSRSVSCSITPREASVGTRVVMQGTLFTNAFGNHPEFTIVGEVRADDRRTVK